MKIILRDHILPVTHIEIQGRKYSLGDYRSINEHDTIKSNFSFSWVGLDSEQVLDSHWHSIDSYIYVYEGEGTSTGSLKTCIKAGDWIYIPAGSFHGFLPSNVGFKAISFQPAPANFFDGHETTGFDRLRANAKEISVSQTFPGTHPGVIIQNLRERTEKIISINHLSKVIVLKGLVEINEQVLGKESSAYIHPDLNNKISIKTIQESEFIIFKGL